MTQRFTNAVTKLYKAFHSGELLAYDCAACAVGNICNNNDEWTEMWQTSRVSGSGILKQKVFYLRKNVLKSGYSSSELAELEMRFLRQFGKLNDEDQHNKDYQFNGLCAVVEYLCELDGILNVMDYSKLFETENKKPKHELQTVFK